MILSPRDALLFSIATLQPEIMHSVVPVDDDHLLSAGLRDYQLKMLFKAAALMRQGYRRVLIQAPTGAGKTRMAAALMGCTALLGYRSQFLVHRKELIKQTSKTFTDVGLPHGFVATGWPFDPDATTMLAGIQTLVNRLHQILPPNLVIVDEAHHATAETYATILREYPDAFILGLSATPERLDGRGLDDQFDVIVLGPSVAWLIEQGHLSPFDFYQPDDPDMTGVPSTAGDYTRSAAAEVVDRPEIVGSIVDHYLRLAPGEQGIVFAANREHSRHIAEEFNGRGIPAMHVDGSMKDGERDHFDDAFRAGDIRIGVNVGLFDEGYDVPNISYVADGAPSKSVVKVRQRWGRALRPAKGKLRAVIADHAGNAMRLADLPDLDREWSLEGRTKRSRGACNDDADPIRQCLVCYRVFPSTLKCCPGCGGEPAPTPREIRMREGELQRIDREEMLRRKKEERLREAAARKDEERACSSYADFYNLGVQRGYTNPHGWASLRMSMKSGGFRFK